MRCTDIFEGAGVIDGIDHQYSSCPFIVGLGNVLEAFLAGGVPNLQFDPLLSDGDGFYLEVHSDGGDVVGSK